jgi:hypothetical protein
MIPPITPNNRQSSCGVGGFAGTGTPQIMNDPAVPSGSSNTRC